MICVDYHGELDACTPDDPYYDPDIVEVGSGYVFVWYTVSTGQVIFEYERW